MTLQHAQEQLTKRVEAGEMHSTTVESKLQEQEGKLGTIMQSQSDISQRLQLVEETTKVQIPALSSDVKSIFECISESPNQLPFDQEMCALGQIHGFVPSSDPQGLLIVDDVESDISLHLLSVPVRAGCTVPITAPYDLLPSITPPEIYHPLSTVSPYSLISASRMPLSAMKDIGSPDDFRYHQDTTGFPGTFIQPSPTGMTEKVCGSPAGAIAKICNTSPCPTDSCRNASIPLESAGMAPESTGMGRNPQEWTEMALEWTKMEILEIRM